MGLTEGYVCILNFRENPFFCFVSSLFEKVLDDLKKNVHTNVLAFLHGLYLGFDCFLRLYQVIYHCFGVGEKGQIRAKKQFEKSIFFKVLHQNRCRHQISECTIGKNARIQPITKSRNFSKLFSEHFVNFSSIFSKFSEFLQLPDFFVFGTGDILFDMWKMIKTPVKNQQIYFCTFQNFHLHSSFINIFTRSWPTFSMPNEVF